MFYSFLQKDMNKEDKEDNVINNQFDIDFKICSEHYEIKSNFKIKTIIRIICNIFIPGSGIFSLLCKFGCHVGSVFIGISQAVSGIFLYLYFFLYY